MEERRNRRIHTAPTAVGVSTFAEGLFLVCAWLAAPAATIMLTLDAPAFHINTALVCMGSGALTAAAYALVVASEKRGRIRLGLPGRDDPTSTSLASFERKSLASLPPAIITWSLLPFALRDFATALLIFYAVSALLTLHRGRKRITRAARHAPTEPDAAAEGTPHEFSLAGLLPYGEGAVCWTSEAAFLRTGGGTLVLDATARATAAYTEGHPFRLIRCGAGFISVSFPAGDVPTRRDAELPEAVIVIENQ